jgi:hypothetical protein
MDISQIYNVEDLELVLGVDIETSHREFLMKNVALCIDDFLWLSPVATTRKDWRGIAQTIQIFREMGEHIGVARVLASLGFKTGFLCGAGSGDGLLPVARSDERDFVFAEYLNGLHTGRMIVADLAVSDLDVLMCAFDGFMVELATHGNRLFVDGFRATADRVTCLVARNDAI